MSDKKKTNWRKNFFNWHMWSGVIFTVPLLLVALTAILIAHEKGLGTKEIAVNAGWLPGYGSEESITHYLDDVKDVVIKNKATYFASKIGVVINHNNQLRIVKGTEGNEVRDIHFQGDSLWIAGKKGLLLAINENAKLIKKGDFHGINLQDKQLIASEGKHGYHTSLDFGKTWNSTKISKSIGKENLDTFSKSIEKESFMEALSLEKLALDIHTGEAFFGKNAMWIWIDLIAISLLFMTFTGIWMWYKRKYCKKKK
jgi:hypothetical protein